MSLGRHLRRASEEKAYATTSRRTSKIDNEWISRIDCIDFLEVMEVLNVSHATNDELLFSCPFPGHSSGDSRPSAYMNLGSNDKEKTSVWKCHGCGRSGNAITFYAEMEQVSKREAAEHLRDQYAPDFRQPRGGTISNEFELWLKEREERFRKEQDEHPLPQIPWDTYDKKFGVDWDAAWEDYNQTEDPVLGYLFERGFDPATLEAWRIGYDDRQERFTIPVCDEDGNCVGVKARTWKSKQVEKIKYLILGDKDGKPKRYGWKHYEKSRVLFGLHMVPKDAKMVVLCEGELDVIALWQIGVPSVCTGGAALSHIQALFLRQFDKVVVFYDSNNAGWEGTAEVVAEMEQFVKLSIVEEHEDDPAGMVKTGAIDELRAMIEDATPSYLIFD